MLVIASISRQITRSINLFWQDCLEAVSEELLNINADELMNIFVYILIQAQLPELVVHLQLVKSFTSSRAKSSMIGYYFVTVEAALVFLESVRCKEDVAVRKPTPVGSFVYEDPEGLGIGS